MLTSKIVHIKQIYKFYFENFLEKRKNQKNAVKKKAAVSDQTMQDTKKC